MKTRLLLTILLAGLALLSFAPAVFSQNVTLGRTYSANDGYKYFTVNGAPTFLKTISYFGAMSIDSSRWEEDLRRFKSEGINCVRIFGNWWEGDGIGDPQEFTGIFADNCCSAVWLYDPDGTGGIAIGDEHNFPINDPTVFYLARLIDFCSLCDDAGMVVDISFYWKGLENLGSSQGGPFDIDDIKACLETVVDGIQGAGLENVYFDVANEFDGTVILVGNDDDETAANIETLVSHIKGLMTGYQYLCTASALFIGPDDDYPPYNYTPPYYKEDLLEALIELDNPPLDFLAPHLRRETGCWDHTGANVEEMIDKMESYTPTRRTPILLQEPFSVTHMNFTVTEADLIKDLKTGKAAGASGWCFHNQGCLLVYGDSLFDHLNSVEISFFDNSYRVTAEGSTLHTVADFDGDGVDEAIVDFGSTGVWIYDYGDWDQISGSNPKDMITADVDGDGRPELVINFGVKSLYFWDAAGGGSLTQMIDPQDQDSPSDLRIMIAADSDNDGEDEIIAGFDTPDRVYVWDGGTTWYQISTSHVFHLVKAQVNGSGDEEFAGDFGSLGVWLWINDGWTQMTGDRADSLQAADTDNDGSEEIIFNAGVWEGLWLWDYNGGNPDWSGLSDKYADSICVLDLDGDGVDELAGDFGCDDFWLYNGGNWYKYTDYNAELLISADVYDDSNLRIVADFGSQGTGLYLLDDQYVWDQLAGTEVEHLWAGDLDGDGEAEILADFGSLYLGGWENGVWTWTQISTCDPD